MNKLLSLSDNDRQTIFEQTAARMNLPATAIEKDFWVTELLNILFTLPYASKMVFKGGTSLSKAWGLIRRFSEDIDIAIDRNLFGIEGDLTKKQLKNLRKTSSAFVRDRLAADLDAALEQNGLKPFLSLVPEPDGTGDHTYPEPRQIHIYYQSVFRHATENTYLREEVLLEVGARSLFEPTAQTTIQSFVASIFPHFSVDNNAFITTALAEKTFLEKTFLLHELFTTEGYRNAYRKSRHLYDLYKMMETDVADKAIANTELWISICHHRKTFTSVKGIDYRPDMREHLLLVPPKDARDIWRNDYETMARHMIYDEIIPSFDDLLSCMAQLEARFKTIPRYFVSS